MDDRHAPGFELELTAAMEINDSPPPSEVALRLWWSVLEPYPWEVVSAALSEHCRQCKFRPRPADILERMEACDGRPTSDEAWSLALQAQDEAATVVWTREINEAWGSAMPVLAARDQVGARHAFVSAYKRLCAEARHTLSPVQWLPSLGTDRTARAGALSHAVAQGRLPVHQVRSLLPPQERTEMTAVAGLLTGNVTALPDLQTREARRYLAAVKGALVTAARRKQA